MNRSLTLSGVALAALTLASCDKGPTEITATGSDPSIELNAWCEEGGVMALGATYGIAEPVNTLVGTGGGVWAMGGEEEFSRSYGQSDDIEFDVPLIVTASPQEGQCTVSITDKASGDTLTKKVKRRDVEIRGIMPGA